MRIEIIVNNEKSIGAEVFDPRRDIIDTLKHVFQVALNEVMGEGSFRVRIDKVDEPPTD